LEKFVKDRVNVLHDPLNYRVTTCDLNHHFLWPA
jgi:hypothetical protein